jgi:hypothetical protein
VGNQVELWVLCGQDHPAIKLGKNIALRCCSLYRYRSIQAKSESWFHMAMTLDLWNYQNVTVFKHNIIPWNWDMLIYTLLYNRLSLCSVKTIYEIITLEDMMCWSLNIFNMYLYWLLLVYFTFLNNELSHEKTILTFHFFLVMQFWLLNFILFLLCLCCPVVFSWFIYTCLFCVCRKKMPARDVKKMIT